MDKTKPNDMAFPLSDDTGFDTGLTKREYFAATAMQGLCAADADLEFLTEESVNLADKLIMELNELIP